MYPGKPPLQQLAYQGSPGGPGSIFREATAHARKSTSENCDPNLSTNRKVQRKGDSHTCASGQNHSLGSAESTFEQSKPDAESGGSVCEHYRESERSRNEGKDVHPCGGKNLTSPARVTSSPGQGRRQHNCRNPRCASNNPDYAVPAQVEPRKYLISKRHLLPGAICTRDPSSLISQTTQTLTPSTVKSPVKATKLNKPQNSFRQPSFTDVSDSATTSLVDKISSALDTEFRSDATVENSYATIDNAETTPVAPANDHNAASEAQDYPIVVPVEYCTIGESSCDVEKQQLCPLDTGGENPDQLGQVNIETNCLEDDHPVTVGVSDLGSEDFTELEQCRLSDFSSRTVQATALLDALSNLTSLNSISDGCPTLVYLHDPPEPLPSAGCPDGSSDLSSAEYSPIDVEDVTKVLEQKLALERMEESTNCQDEVLDNEGLASDLRAASEDGCSLQDCTEGGSAEENDGNAETQRPGFGATAYDSEGQFVVCLERKCVEENGSVSGTETTLCDSADELHVQRVAPKWSKGRGRQLWRNDCRNSREVVTLKPTSHGRQPEQWMADRLLEGAIERMNPSGEGRVRVLVEAFESLMSMSEPEPEKRPSRVWCFNRMEKGEVDHDGDVFEEGDQTVDCYEVSGDRLELRASMRLSLGGSNRHNVCSIEEESEFEMSAIQKVQEWNDCPSTGPSQCNSAMGKEHESEKSAKSTLDVAMLVNQFEKTKDGQANGEHSDGNSQGSEPHGHLADRQVNMNDHVRRRIKMFNDAKQQLGYKADDNVKVKIQRYGRSKGFSKSSSVKSESEAPSSITSGSGEKSYRVRNTLLAPFRLLTEERGAMKEYQFAKKLEQMFSEEERLRNPVAQGLPWTTDEAQVVPKPPVKEQTKHIEFRHYSDLRAVERAQFDYYVAERQMFIDMQKEEQERLRQIEEQEEIKRLRREMVPRAQLMPFFDQPFMPSRSSKRLTVPKEPNFKRRQHKRAKCIVWQAGSS